MELLREALDSIRWMEIRRFTAQSINLGMIVTFALMLWKLWMCISGNESPVVVVLSGSMEPGFKRGDILFLQMNRAPVRSGEIIVFRVDGKDIPIVHRVVQVHEQRGTGEINVLTKGDNNPDNDRHGVYAADQLWVQQRHVIGKAIGFLPYVGWPTIIMTDNPLIKGCWSLPQRTIVDPTTAWDQRSKAFRTSSTMISLAEQPINSGIWETQNILFFYLTHR